MKTIVYILCILSLFACAKKDTNEAQMFGHLKYSEDILEYKITPTHKFDKNGLMFSDQGAWFAYSSPDSLVHTGFSGPFLMTQQNGIWSSAALVNLTIENNQWTSITSKSYSSHLEQKFSSENIELKQELVFFSGHTALLNYTIKNISHLPQTLHYHFNNTPLLADGLTFYSNKNQLNIASSKTNAIGYILFPENIVLNATNRNYKSANITLKLNPNQTEEFTMSQTFMFPEYSWKQEKERINNSDFAEILNQIKTEKNNQINVLTGNLRPQFRDPVYAEALAKAQLTLQNNWRIPAGEIKYEGLFPSYHYKWFNGFWSWDSWKHSTGLSYYNTDLAKEHIKLMFEFQNEDGFVADVVYRDTTIEAHNYRDTKPPLSAWAVAKIFEKDSDTTFVQYMYPKLKKYHYWWYNKRDHDRDGICEYGSTDGSLIAAKWESGMDNAIRFDDSEIVKNSEGAYSLNQESVDLNAYLYAEKLYLHQLAKIMGTNDSQQYLQEAQTLKKGIQTQFFDSEDGWFYDTSLDGKTFIKGEGSEGWTALWAHAATQKQAEAVKNRMMNPDKFYTTIPFQTMSADNEKFDPLKGYWRGPNWLDQAYFGVQGLRNYGYNTEADKATIKILKGAEGLLEKGKPIRENYHPITGQGLHAKNFSWSAAHVIMLLLEN